MIPKMIVKEGDIRATTNKIVLRVANFEGNAAMRMRLVYEAVSQGVAIILGDALKHFEIFFGGNQHAYYVIVRPKDDIGRIIYHGHKGEYPIGEDGQYLANPEGNFGPVAGPVMHPGFEGKKAAIDAEVRLAMNRTVMMTR
jgi:hypothetical protein